MIYFSDLILGNLIEKDIRLEYEKNKWHLLALSHLIINQVNSLKIIYHNHLYQSNFYLISHLLITRLSKIHVIKSP